MKKPTNINLIEKKLESILSDEIDSAKNNLIFTTNEGYSVFDIYKLIKQGTEIEISKHHNVIGVFSSTRTAISWCIVDKYKQYRLSDEIQQLDLSRKRLRDDVETSNLHMHKFKNSFAREIAELKLDTKKSLLGVIEQRLDKCANLAKYWQLRGFNNEIERTRRPAQNRDYRSSIRVASR